MAKVKIQGNASGTGILTITAPNTSTDRTITLPDSTGTLATTADVPSSITDNGDATAITIDSSERVGIGAAPASGVAMTITKDGTGADMAGIRFIDSNSGNAQQIYNYQGNLYFRDATAGVTRIRVDSDGLKFNNDSAAANALNDYEEGSFTPVFTGSSGSTGSYNTGEHEARYTKIGRLVVIQFKLTLTHKGSWGGEVRFTGLPFSVSDTMPATGSVTLAYVDIPGDASNHNVYVTSGVTYWRVQYTTDNNTTSMVLLSETANNASFSGTFSYTTND